MSPLQHNLDEIFFYIRMVSTFMIAIITIMRLFGIIHITDVFDHNDSLTMVEHPDGHESSSVSKFFSVSAIIYFFCGMTWIQWLAVVKWGADYWFALGVSVFSGIVVSWAMGMIILLLLKLTQDNTIKEGSLVGTQGSIYLVISESKPYGLNRYHRAFIVQVDCHGYREVAGRICTDDITTLDSLDYGTKVKLTNYDFESKIYDCEIIVSE